MPPSPQTDMPQSRIDADLEAWREARDKNRIAKYHECQKCYKDLECDEPSLFESGDCQCAIWFEREYVAPQGECQHEL